jgi:hypothetical protein
MIGSLCFDIHIHKIKSREVEVVIIRITENSRMAPHGYDLLLVLFNSDKELGNIVQRKIIVLMRLQEASDTAVHA